MSAGKRIDLIVFAATFLMVLVMHPSLYAQDGRIPARVPQGVYIDLSQQFYEALQGGGQRGTRTYSNDPSLEYLKQIAVSARFVVETNLEILKQQERLIQLLEDVNGKKSAEGPPGRR